MSKVKPIVFRPKYEIEDYAFIIHDNMIEKGRIEKRKFMDYGEEDMDSTDKETIKLLNEFIIEANSKIRQTKTLYKIFLKASSKNNRPAAVCIWKEENELFKNALQASSYLLSEYEDNEECLKKDYQHE